MRKNRKIMQLFSQKNDTVMEGQTNIDRSQSTRQTGSHNSQARWFALSTKFGMTKRYAFTLAEVLITLGIIGVVAAITLPAFMENVNSRVKAKRMENIHQKLSKVTDKMASLDVLQGHASTHDFVYEMKKHMNIAKICENDNIAGCWPKQEVILNNGKTWDISKVLPSPRSTVDVGQHPASSPFLQTFAMFMCFFISVINSSVLA